MKVTIGFCGLIFENFCVYGWILQVRFCKKFKVCTHDNRHKWVSKIIKSSLSDKQAKMIVIFMAIFTFVQMYRFVNVNTENPEVQQLRLQLWNTDTVKALTFLLMKNIVRINRFTERCLTN